MPRLEFKKKQVNLTAALNTDGSGAHKFGKLGSYSSSLDASGAERMVRARLFFQSGILTISFATV
jgi:hypothetical protein